MGVKVGTSPCMRWSSTLVPPHTPPSSSPFHSVSPKTRSRQPLLNATPCNLIFWTDHRPSLRRISSARLLRSSSFTASNHNDNLTPRPIRRSASSPFDTLYPLNNDDDDEEEEEEDIFRFPSKAKVMEENNINDDDLLSSFSGSINNKGLISLPTHIVDASPPPWLGNSPEGSIATMVKSKTKSMLIKIPVSLPKIKTARKKKKKPSNRQTSTTTDKTSMSTPKHKSSSSSSMKKAFSSMVLIIRELHIYTLQLRERMLLEDMKAALLDIQKEMNASFCWLFHQIFSCTPTLMLSVMLLLANFTVHSMSTKASTPPPLLLQQFQIQTHESMLSINNKLSSLINIDAPSYESLGSGASGGGVKQRLVASATDDGHEAWKKFVEEAESMQAEARHEALMEMQNLLSMVAPVKVVLPEEEHYGDHPHYARTELMYQLAVQEDPKNSLLLSNYAQFLYVVAHDHDRAEHYFKRAAEVVPVDEESLKQYANFLWVAKKDVFAADQTYLTAIAADPSNTALAANYAHFLWCTDACFPIDA